MSGKRVFPTLPTLRRERSQEKPFSRRIKQASVTRRREKAKLILKSTLFPTSHTVR
uniref:Uncharacterized protein n=1 Tax=Cucumis melo TaxID=3656 RepID=A0A9I9EH24_CUCME